MEVKQTNINFKGGLTKEVNQISKKISPREISSQFTSEFKVDANFKDNNGIAMCNALVANIFEHLNKKYKLPFTSMPPRIRVFEKSDLHKPVSSNTFGFCIPDSRKVLKSEEPFELRSLFFDNKYKSLEEIDSVTENSYKKGLVSSDHFLGNTIHEFVHNFHIDEIFKKFGYGGDCPYGIQKYDQRIQNPKGIKIVEDMQNTQLSTKEKEIITEHLGAHSADENILEVIPEYFTKLIIKSLDTKTLLPVKDPFKDIKEPKEFIKIINKCFYQETS